MDIDKLCYGCMQMKDDTQGACPHCGFDQEKYNLEPRWLPHGTIINGKYMVGRVLGEGGFGITYIGMDLNLEMPVAIKEYYPNGYCGRDCTARGGTTVSTYSGNKKDFYKKGLERFLDEAKNIAKLSSLSGIARVIDFFNENNTAYIVMEYVDGITLKEYLKSQGGIISVEMTLRIMEPVIKSLGIVHAEGIIHRDISPDNIMISNKNELKLLDFGAARKFLNNNDKSMSIMLKPGYAPEEQYRSSAKQGPFTDIYALCATLYKMITGKTPIESLERLSQDNILWPSQMGININPNIENAIRKGMAVNASDRIKSIKELYSYLYGSAIADVSIIGNCKNNVGYSYSDNSGISKQPIASIYKQGNVSSNDLSEGSKTYLQKHTISLISVIILGIISVLITFSVQNHRLQKIHLESNDLLKIEKQLKI